MKIRKWEDFSNFIGMEMCDLIKAMPEHFDRLVLDYGRQVWANIYTGKKIEILHDCWGIIKEVNRLD